MDAIAVVFGELYYQEVKVGYCGLHSALIIELE